MKPKNKSDFVSKHEENLKAILKEIDKKKPKNKLIFVSKYEENLKIVLKEIDKNKERVCYITFNKSSNYLIQSFIKSQFNMENIYFIDGITSILACPEDQENCEFVKNAADLDNVLIAVERALKEGYTTIVIDSISNILAYETKRAHTSLFIRHIAELIKEKEKGRLIILCNKEDEDRLTEYKFYDLINLYKSSSWPMGLPGK